jgi:thymidylate kinase
MSEVEPGKRSVIEGNDGTGKTTYANMFAWQVQKNGFLTLRIDEPDSPIDQDGNVLLPHVSALRTEIKDGSYEHNPHADLGQFNVSRFLSWTRVTKPLMIKGYWPIQTRDKTSSEGYQGGGDGLGIEYVDKTVRDFMNDELYFEPDFKTVLVFKDDMERLKRIQTRGPLDKPDTFESRSADFQARVNNAYLQSAARDNLDITEIEAHQPREEIADIIFEKAVGAIGINLVKYDWEEYFASQQAA